MSLEDGVGSIGAAEADRRARILAEKKGIPKSESQVSRELKERLAREKLNLADVKEQQSKIGNDDPVKALRDIQVARTETAIRKLEEDIKREEDEWKK